MIFLTIKRTKLLVPCIFELMVLLRSLMIMGKTVWQKF